VIILGFWSRAGVGPGRTLGVTRTQLTNEQWEFIEPYLPIGEYGPYPERLREQFEGVIWRFRSSAQWREMPSEFGPWPTVYGRFRVWRDAGVFSALLEGMIAEAARRGQTDLSLVSVDSTTARAHQDAAGMHLGKDVMDALEEAAAEQERARQKGAARRDRTGRTAGTTPSRKSDGVSGGGASSG
jgi:transposase